MAAICAITNQANLPAFVVVEVLEKVAREMNVLVERELAMDMQSYREAVEKEKAQSASDASTSAVVRIPTQVEKLDSTTPTD